MKYLLLLIVLLACSAHAQQLSLVQMKDRESCAQSYDSLADHARDIAEAEMTLEYQLYEAANDASLLVRLRYTEVSDRLCSVGRLAWVRKTDALFQARIAARDRSKDRQRVAEILAAMDAAEKTEYR